MSTEAMHDLAGAGPAAPPLEARRRSRTCSASASPGARSRAGPCSSCSAVGVLATLAYLATLLRLARGWASIPQPWRSSPSPWSTPSERAGDGASARGWKVASWPPRRSFPEWRYDLFLQSVQVRALWGAVWRTSKSW